MAGLEHYREMNQSKFKNIVVFFIEPLKEEKILAEWPKPRNH